MSREQPEAAAHPGGAPPPARLAAFLAARDVDVAGAAFVAPTRTRVDVGHWLGKRRVWLVGAGGRLVLAAWGRRPFFEVLERGDLAESVYNHVTAAVVFGPRAGAVPQARVPPDVGYALLDFLGARRDPLQEAYDGPRRG